MLTVSRALQIQYLSLVMLKDIMLTATLHLSNKVTVYLLDHRSRMRKVGSRVMHRSDDTKECMCTKVEALGAQMVEIFNFKFLK